MSAVRGCDKCGTIFFEGIEGSATGQVTLMVKSEKSGRAYPEQRNQDFCPRCAGGTAVQPVLAISSGKDESGFSDE